MTTQHRYELHMLKSQSFILKNIVGLHGNWKLLFFPNLGQRHYAFANIFYHSDTLQLFPRSKPSRGMSWKVKFVLLWMFISRNTDDRILFINKKKWVRLATWPVLWGQGQGISACTMKAWNSVCLNYLWTQFCGECLQCMLC